MTSSGTRGLSDIWAGATGQKAKAKSTAANELKNKNFIIPLDGKGTGESSQV
jgi:hypothetical protein